MVTGERCLGVLRFEWGEPVLGTPGRGVSGVDGDDRDRCVVDHLGETVPELRARKSRDVTTEGPASLASRRPVPGVLATLDALGNEIGVSRHRCGSVWGYSRLVSLYYTAWAAREAGSEVSTTHHPLGG